MYICIYIYMCVCVRIYIKKSFGTNKHFMTSRNNQSGRETIHNTMNRNV